MVRVIVNADDIGLSAGVTRGITRAMLDGVVTSATLMTSMSDAPGAAAQVARYGLDVGVHLDLTQGRPLSDVDAVPSLVNERGEFWDAGALRVRLRRGLVALGEVESELVRQVERAFELGVRPTHLDSHHHVHASLGVARVMYGVARRYGIDRVRTLRAYEAFSPTLFARLGQADRARNAARATRPGAAGRVPRMPLALLKPGETVADWIGLLEQLAPLPDSCVFEIICHPAEADDELRRLSGWVESREAELRVVTAPELRRAASDLGIRLVSYREL